jgi:hypothetical protein
MIYIKTTTDEIGVPSFDIEQEAYKFATINGLGNAGVRLFYATLDRLGKKASLDDIRKEALRAYEISRCETEEIRNTTKCHVFSMLEYDAPEKPEHYPHDDGPSAA